MSYTEHMPSANLSAESVNKNIQAFVVSLFIKVRMPLLFQVKVSIGIPVRRESKAASVLVTGIVVSRQQAEQARDIHGNRRAMAV
mgnify:FL=1